MNPSLKNSQTAKTCDSVVLFTRRETHAVKKNAQSQVFGHFFKQHGDGLGNF